MNRINKDEVPSNEATKGKGKTKQMLRGAASAPLAAENHIVRAHQIEWKIKFALEM